MSLLLSGTLLLFLVTPIPATAISANPTPNCSAGTTCTITFTFTGDYYSWTVPSGVTSLSVDLSGAQGGTSNELYSPQAGGLGGRVTATLQTSGGQQLFIYVGGRPAASASSGGWNGGGLGGISSAGAGGIGGYAGSGGGASDIRTSINTSDRLIVAGGGGGGGRDYVNGSCVPCGVGGAGGAGGGTTGASGSNSGANGYSYGTGGGGSGGTQLAGGTRGDGVVLGTSGSLAVGGGGGSGSQDVAGGGGGGGFYGGGGGSTPGNGNGGGGGGGGGGSSYAHPTLATSVTHTQGFKSGDGSISITYLNSPIPTTFSTSQTTPTNISTGTSIAYSLILSQSVSDLAVGDFQFGGTSSCNTPTLSGSGTTYTVNITNCSEGTLILQLKANSVTGTSTGPPSVSSANTIVVDRTAPTISGVVSTPAGATYIAGNSLSFQIQMNETVTVSGAPRIPIVVGNVTKYATYASGSNSPRLVFTYTVGNESAEFDTDGIAMTSPLELNSGSIQDLAGNALVALTYSTTSTASVLVAQPAAAPTIDSITASSGTLTVYFTAGAPRGSTTTNYQFSTNNGSSFANRTSGTTASPLVISSLSNGTSYTVRIRAVTNAGNSDSSTSVTATPSAVVVTGDATLTLTYGQSASTSTYSSIGGTSPYTYSLSASVSGVSINSSNGTVTASSTTPAGTYIRNVVATDSAGTPQSGTRQLTITVNKASTSISISLPNSATEAALGGAITITATLTQSGSVNFRLGGSSISGCSSVASSGSTATCSWTPSSLGGASLSAIFTPSDSSNYEAATSTTLSITVVNGVSTVSLSLAGGVTQVVKGQVINMIAAIDQVGRVTFLVDGKRIPGCFNLLASSIGNRSCAWKPVVQKTVNLSARLVPSNNVFNSSTANLTVQVVRRSGAR